MALSFLIIEVCKCLCRCAAEDKQASLYGAFDSVVSEGTKGYSEDTRSWKSSFEEGKFPDIKIIIGVWVWGGGQQRHSLPLSLSLRDSAAEGGSLWGKTLGGQTAPHLYPQQRQCTYTYTHTHTHLSTHTLSLLSILRDGVMMKINSEHLLQYIIHSFSNWKILSLKNMDFYSLRRISWSHFFNLRFIQMKCTSV